LKLNVDLYPPITYFLVYNVLDSIESNKQLCTETRGSNYFRAGKNALGLNAGTTPLCTLNGFALTSVPDPAYDSSASGALKGWHSVLKTPAKEE
jgi:hypothetical protein